MKQFKDVDPPLWVAWNQALAGIRVRIWRHGLTAIGIALGMAFFASVQTMRVNTFGAEPFEIQRLQWLAATSLIMCVVGVTNSMLMSVTERYREIGTIKCLGASDRFIVKVFLLESLVIGLVASLTGSLIGSMAIVVASGAPFLGSLAVVGVSTSLGLLLTVVAAVAPAVQAARMPAAAALRVDI